MDNATIVSDWISEARFEFDAWIRQSLNRFHEDASIRVPRTNAQSENGMSLWLREMRYKMGFYLEEDFRQIFPSLAEKLSSAYISELFDTQVWPQVKPEMQRYAAFSFAAAWAGRSLGDAATLGTPEWDGHCWSVPVGIKNYGNRLGSIVLNSEGEVVSELTTTRRDLLEAIRESSPALTAAAR